MTRVVMVPYFLIFAPVIKHVELVDKLEVQRSHVPIVRDFYCQVFPAIVVRVSILLGHTAATVIKGLQVNVVNETSMNAIIKASVALILAKVFASISMPQYGIVEREDLNAIATMDSKVC